MSTRADCAACRGRLSLFGGCADYEYHRCSTCGTIQLAPLPDKAELARAYASDYAEADHYEADPDRCKSEARRYYQSILRILEDYNVSGTVVDYGTGWGGLCEVLIRKGLSCQGLEISSEMVAYCQSRGLPVRRGDLTALAEARAEISALVLCTVFEHLVDHDAWLARAHRLLRDEGLLVTLQPTAAFADFMGSLLRFGSTRRPLPKLHRVFSPPWHTVLFSHRGMRILASRNGFDLLEIRAAPQGRAGGLTGLAQLCLELANRLGWRLAGSRWPLMVAHTFIFGKASGSAPASSRPSATEVNSIRSARGARSN